MGLKPDQVSTMPLCQAKQVTLCSRFLFLEKSCGRFMGFGDTVPTSFRSKGTDIVYFFLIASASWDNEEVHTFRAAIPKSSPGKPQAWDGRELNTSRRDTSSSWILKPGCAACEGVLLAIPFSWCWKPQHLCPMPQPKKIEMQVVLTITDWLING